MWQSQSDEQRITVTLHEYCPISGVGIWFECLLMKLLLRDIYGENPAQPHVRWALSEIADECRHPVTSRGRQKSSVRLRTRPPPPILR
jgi:hypothetical protein